MPDEVLEHIKGTYREHQLSLKNSEGDAITSYTSSFTPSAAIWNGDETASVASPTLEWISAAAGTLKLILVPANTSSLTVQPYPIRCYLTRPSDSHPIEIWRGWLDLKHVPGAVATLKTYASYEDMQRFVGPWLKTAMYDGQQAGFTEDRNRARKWLDAAILARYRPFYSTRGSSLLSLGVWQETPGVDPTLKTYLDADKLLVRDRVVEIVSRKAIMYVCERMIAAGKTDNPYAYIRSLQQTELEGLLSGFVAEIDTNADGTADILIPFNVISFRG